MMAGDQSDFETKYPLPSGIVWNSARGNYEAKRPAITVYKALLQYRVLWQCWLRRGEPIPELDLEYKYHGRTNCVIIMDKGKRLN